MLLDVPKTSIISTQRRIEMIDYENNNNHEQGGRAHQIAQICIFVYWAHNYKLIRTKG